MTGTTTPVNTNVEKLLQLCLGRDEPRQQVYDPLLMPDSTQLGARIAALRETRGWSQADLAQHADMKPATISAIERGRSSSPKLADVIRLAETLAVGLEELVYGDDITRPAQSVQADLRDELADLREAVEEQRSLIERLASTLQPSPQDQ